MKFKEPHMKEQFEGRPPKLKEICYFFEELSLGFDIEPVVTRVLDKVSGESGVHPVGRAVDFRDECRDKNGVKHLYTEEQAQFIVDEINSKYPRDDDKEVCIHHSFAAGPEHFHIQIPFAWGHDLK